MTDLPADAAWERLVLLAADLDDETPETLGAAADALFEAGALDVTFLSTTMKKSRPGIRLEVLARPEAREALAGLILRETATLGVRSVAVERVALARRAESIIIFEAEISVKVALWDGNPLKAKAESEELRALARRLGRSFREVSATAQAAIQARFFS
ncbi:MAG: pyridinium-3,5-bisthiocarboxylic acid mononucleotide nickel chelatase [Sumerlaeia bacterium]